MEKCVEQLQIRAGLNGVSIESMSRILQAYVGRCTRHVDLPARQRINSVLIEVAQSAVAVTNSQKLSVGFDCAFRVLATNIQLGLGIRGGTAMS
jgi:hypothetical protein